MAGTPTRKGFADCYHQALLNANRKWRAVDVDGVYLHMNGTDFTKDEFWAWRGTGAQFKRLNSAHDNSLRPVAVEGAS